jgi:hypothetical protein
VVKRLIKPIEKNIRHFTADGAYDTNPTYRTIAKKFPSADIVIPPQKNAVDNPEKEIFLNLLFNDTNVFLRISFMHEILSDKNKKEL